MIQKTHWIEPIDRESAQTQRLGDQKRAIDAQACECPFNHIFEIGSDAVVDFSVASEMPARVHNESKRRCVGRHERAHENQYQK